MRVEEGWVRRVAEETRDMIRMKKQETDRTRRDGMRDLTVQKKIHKNKWKRAQREIKRDRVDGAGANRERRVDDGTEERRGQDS